MGLYKPCYSTSAMLGSVEWAIIRLYKEADTRAASPGFDDLLGQPFLVDNDNDQIGEHVRVEQEIRVKAKFSTSRFKEQSQDQTGNAPTSFVKLTLYEEDLAAQGYLVAGVLEIRNNDRLLRMENDLGVTRINFEADGSLGLRCYGVDPGETGTGIYEAQFESPRKVSS